MATTTTTWVVSSYDGDGNGVHVCGGGRAGAYGAVVGGEVPGVDSTSSTSTAVVALQRPTVCGVVSPSLIRPSNRVKIDYRGVGDAMDGGARGTEIIAGREQRRL